uniref:hypothetical protein n=1 Tax=Actinokineospora sp. CA-119265 TaxID=3239890 RepID=UPI003F496FF4
MSERAVPSEHPDHDGDPEESARGDKQRWWSVLGPPVVEAVLELYTSDSPDSTSVVKTGLLLVVLLLLRGAESK